ncbi:hypothetical protein GCM10027212_07790 [Actinotalea caeni]
MAMLATWPRRVALALLLLLPVVVAALGGFRPGEPTTRTVEAGVPTDTGAYLVVPHGYFVSDRVDAYGLEDGEQWVGVVVELTNQGDEPIYLTFNDETFRLPDGVVASDLASAQEAIRLDTGTNLGEVQPGLRYEVALLWRTAVLADPPPELTLSMTRTIYREWSIEAGYYTWRATEDAYEVALPLVEPPEIILEDEEDL